MNAILNGKALSDTIKKQNTKSEKPIVQIYLNFCYWVRTAEPSWLQRHRPLSHNQKQNKWLKIKNKIQNQIPHSTSKAVS